MSSLSFTVDRKSKDKILKEIGITEDKLQDAVICLRRWFENQPHLPEVPSQNKMEFALLTFRMDIQKTQDTFDFYYTIKSSMPQIYNRCNPNNPLMQLCAETCQIVLLPELLEDKYRVFLFKLTSKLPSEIDAYLWTAAGLNGYEVLMEEGVFLDAVMVFDLSHIGMKHIFKITPKYISDTFFLIEHLLDNRIKEFHLMNAPPIFELVLNICKIILKPQVYNKFKFHNSANSLAEYIPWEMLPSDYGGKSLSIDRLQKLWIEKQKEYQYHFDKLDTLKVNEDLRPTPSKTIDRSLFGSFAKLFK